MKTKSFIFIILAFCCVLSLAFVSSNMFSEAKTQKVNSQETLSELPKDSVEICGVVEKIEANRFLIDTDKSGLVYITVTNDTEIFKGAKKASVTDIKVGSRLQIAHNGIVLKSYPGQINTVYRVTVLEAENL